MFYNYNKSGSFEYNECSGSGMCSIAPSISSFQEVMLIILHSITFYVLKLEKLNYNCNEIKKSLVANISNLISSTVYSDEQLLNIIICNYNDLIRLKREYKELCKSRDIECRDLKLKLKLKPNMGLSDVLSLGQRFINIKNKKMDATQKCYAELLFVAIKSVSLSIVKLLDFGHENEYAISKVLDAVNTFNFSTFPLNKAKILISDLAAIDLELWQQRKDAQTESFGSISKTEVSFSTRAGKAILVSGSSLNDLYNLLNYLKDKKIDVYTHGDLLIAHIFEKFKEFDNLKGHFGTANDNCVLDFATFPGPILLTKHATQNIEYLIRGRLFTTSSIAPKGVTKIEDNDYSVMVAALENSKGFARAHKRDSVAVGFDINYLSDKLDEISEKLDKGIIQNIFLFGMSNFSNEQADYFDQFLKLIPKNSYVISFSYHCPCENLLYLNIANNFPLQLTVLDLFFSKIPVTSNQLTFFLTKCDANTLSIMISLKEKGVKNIYLSSCPPTIINPAVMNSFMQLYSINNLSSPKADLNKIL